MQLKQIFIVLFVEAISMNEGTTSSSSPSPPPIYSTSTPGSTTSPGSMPPPIPSNTTASPDSTSSSTPMPTPIPSTPTAPPDSSSNSSTTPTPHPTNTTARPGELLVRCDNDTFDTLMCLPGTVVSITRISVDASTTVCRLSQGHCTVEWPADREFSARARTACDGRLTCNDLRADVDEVQCVGSSSYVDVSYINIEYTCENSTANAGTLEKSTEGIPLSTIPSSASSPSAAPTLPSVRDTSPSTALGDTAGTSGDITSVDYTGTATSTEPVSSINRNGGRRFLDVAIAVPVVIVILLVIILVVCLVRRRKRKQYIWGESEVSTTGEHSTHGSNRANSCGWNSEINGRYDMSSPTHSSHPDLVPTNSMTRPSSTASSSKRNTANKNSYRKTMDVIVEYQPEGPLTDVEPRPSFLIAMGSDPRGYITDEPVRDTVQNEESKSEVDKTAIPETVTEFPATDNGTTKSKLKPSFSISMGSDSHGYSEVQPLSATKPETSYIADSATPGSQDVTPGAKVNPPDVPGSNTLGIMTEERGATSNIYSEVCRPEEEQPKVTGIALYSEVDNGMGNPDTRYRPTADTDIYSEVRDPNKSVVDNVTHSDAPKHVDMSADGETPDQGANNVYSEVRKPKHTSPDGNTAVDTSGGIQNQEDSSANIYSEVQKPNKSLSDGLAAEINDAKATSETSAGDENPEDTSPIYSGDGQPPILPARQYTDDLTQDSRHPGISSDGNENSKPEQTSLNESGDASSEGTKLAETPDQ